jgi:hypothetical protein
MTSAFSLYRSELDGYSNDSFVDRIITGLGRKSRYATLTALFCPADAPRSAILNRCRDRAATFTDNDKMRKLFWIPPFRSWDMLTIGNLSLALLWHIYRSLPQEVLADEKIIYKLGKISVTLPALTDGLRQTGTNYALDSERYTSIMNKAFPADRKSSVSSIFSACEQITELSETFRSIGSQIGSIGKFDSLVVPVVDIDLCLPEQAISLLFAIRNFICCESISFIIATDRDILSNFIISLYNNSLTSKQGLKTLLAFFDDWVYLPPPSLVKMIQCIDIKLNTKEKEYIISTISKSGILNHFSDPALIDRGFNRFNSFINNSLERYSTDEYAFASLLFLYNTLYIDSLQTLALLPDLKQIIHTIRHQSEIQETSSANTNRPITSTTPFSNLSAKRKNLKKNLPHGLKVLLEKNNNLLIDIFSIIPELLSDTMIARLIVKIVPYI